MDSAPPPDWLTSVSRPFDDNPELQLAARQELAERTADADPGALSSLGRRFDAIDQVAPKKRILLSWFPIALSTLLTLGIGLPTTLSYRGVSQSMKSMQGPVPGGYDSMAEAASGLSPEDRLFIFGDQTQPTSELARKALWETQPKNPALYADYISHCDPLPADFLETARRIDPDNGWFLLVAAGELGRKAVEKVERPKPPGEGERPIAGPWKIKDEEKLREALDLIAAAAAKPRIEYYGTGLLKERLKRFPPEKTFVSRLPRLIIAASASSGDAFNLLGTANAISARAYLLGEAGEGEATLAHVKLGELHCERLSHQDGNLIFHLINLANCLRVYGHLIDACEKAGLEEEASRLRPRFEAIRKIRKRGLDWEGEEAMRFRKHGGILASITAPAVGQFGIPPPPVEDMKPGRLMNYSLVERGFLWASTIHFLVLSVMAIIMARLRGKLPTRLGRRVSHLLGPADWIWILGLGTLFPLAWLFAITRLTPLGCRDLSLIFFSYQPFFAQYTATAYLVIFATLCTVRWRLGAHAGVLGFKPPRPGWSLLPIATCAVCIPLAGCMRFGSSLAPLYGVAGLLIATSLWMLWLAGRTLFGNRSHSPYRATIATILAPAFAITSVIMIVLVPLTHLSEHHWISQDELGRTSPENLGMGRLEADGVRVIQAKLQSALDAKP